MSPLRRRRPAGRAEGGYTLWLALAALSVGVASGEVQRTSASRQGLRSLLARRTTGQNRTMWNGCPCKPSWGFEETACDTGCCNPDNDTLGEWCEVEDSTDSSLDYCRGSIWGYCRPVGLVLGSCQDSPPLWRDSEGDDCIAYGQQQWCTTDGKQGPGWESEWGNISSFLTDGKTAAEACCVCGGGGDIHSNNCVDKNWQDKDGDSCDEYHTSNYCTKDGRPGLGWLEVWGTFSNYSVSGVSGVDACCACGGGDTVQGSSTPALGGVTTRTTVLGCTCKKSWSDLNGGKTCEKSCCNTDEDPAGDWCFVENPDCEDADWGYCRPLRPTAGFCHDVPEDWEDSEGNSCHDYSSKKWCLENGGQGAGWSAARGSFDKFYNDGHTAATACCDCGGGSMTGSGTSSCQDKPDWEDTDGDSCATYDDDTFCTSAGQFGFGWHEEWGTFADFASKGLAAPQACCACGGGSATNFAAAATAQGMTPSPDDEEAAAAPKATTANVSSARPKRVTYNECACKENWTDDSGHTCATSCCNPDNDEEGEWCKVVSADCEESDWGYCQSQDDVDGSHVGGCTDVAGWVDSEGEDCFVYSAQDYCTLQGTQGTAWQQEWGPLEQFANKGYTALTACCLCGGGTNSGEHPNCVDELNFKDEDGDTCADYEAYAWCTRDQEAGAGWHDDDWNGLPAAAIKACCACGGGTKLSQDLLAANSASDASSAGSTDAGGSVETKGAGIGAILMLVLVVVAVSVGLAVGWFCYRAKGDGKSIAPRTPGLPYGRKHNSGYSDL